MPQPFISVVSPVYMAKSIVPELVRRIVASVSQITEDFEVILVEDGCPEYSWDSIEMACAKDARIKGVRLSRNFGQHYAITAGLTLAKGEWIVVMDCDLQDQPESIPLMFNEVGNGYKIIQGKRLGRQDGFLKKMMSKYFYYLLSYLIGRKINHEVANFGIYHKNAVRAILSMGDNIRYLPTMVDWVGFQKIQIYIDHDQRYEGKSTYNLGRLIRLSIDVILINSDKPIRLIIKFGFFLAVTSFAFAIFYFLRYLKGDIEVEGYTSLIISIWMVSGFILSTLGIIGLYVGKTFETVKLRPLFLIDETLNISNED